MSRVIDRNEVIVPDLELSVPQKIYGLWPVLVPLALALAIIFARLELGANEFLKEGTLTVLALVCYISAAVLFVTNLFVKEDILSKLGLWTTALGYAFGFSGWMMRWIQAGDKENWIAGKVWRYFPLDNLYALTLGFCCGAALTTLIIIRKPKYRMLGAFSLPLISVVLTLGVCLGNEIRTLMPILDSYWRPIHVSIATVAYGVCLMSFGIAFAYLLKDGIRTEALAIAVSLFGFLVLCTIGRSGAPFGIFTPHGGYGASLVFVSNNEALKLRTILPGVGPLMILTLLAITGALVIFIANWKGQDASLGKWAWRFFWGATALQALTLVVLSYQITHTSNPLTNVPGYELAYFGGTLADGGSMEPGMKPEVGAQLWLRQFDPQQFKVAYTSDPVSHGALAGLLVGMLMVGLIAKKRSDVTSALPSLEQLDSLLYRTVGVALPLLSMLLITGAVWANESWGRYWGWDPKEVGALVSWFAYAAYLHTRISHGWRGRKSAYFALLGFILVIFTWLGVSFLLPGLHSYAGV